MALTVACYFASIFFLIYGLRSFIAGLKNEKKSFWFIVGYSQGLKDLLKDKYPQVLNIAGGSISFIGGLIALVTLIIRGGAIR